MSAFQIQSKNLNLKIRHAWAAVLKLLTPPRRINLTLGGKIYVALGVAITFAAINAGNNLLYAILGLLLSFVVVSGLISESTLRYIAVSRSPAGPVFAGVPAVFKVTITNAKKYLPSFGVEVREILSSSINNNGANFLKIGAQTSLTSTERITFARRGRHTILGYRITTTFPFGIIIKSRDIKIPTQVMVYPAPHPVSEQHRSVAYQLGEIHQPRIGSGTDFHSIRNYQTGDDTRNIHWKRTAQLGRLIVCEREDISSRKVVLHIDNSLGDMNPPLQNNMEALDKACSEAAWLAKTFISQDFQVGIESLDQSLPPNTGATQLKLIYEFLALSEPVAHKKPIQPDAPRDSRVVHVQTSSAS